MNQKRAEAFAETMAGRLNDAAIVLMTSIGHRTGLFDRMAGAGPLTAAQIAAHASLDERYVREWLGAMVTGGVVEFDSAGETYELPPEHAACLTRAASPDNISATAQWIPVLASVEDEIVTCFEEGGGVPYSSYPRFHTVMAEESEQTVLSAVLDQILPIVPGLVDRLNRGIDVVDIGCGSGRAVNKMADAFPASRFAGFDVSGEAIAAGRTEAARLGVTNVEHEVVDLARLGIAARFDLVTAFDVIHDQADPAAVLRNVYSALRPGGIFLMQDIGASSHVEGNLDHPLGPFLYTISCLHCMTVSLSSGGAGLGAMWGEETARKMLEAAGFIDVEVQRLPHDQTNYYYTACKPE